MMRRLFHQHTYIDNKQNFFFYYAQSEERGLVNGTMVVALADLCDPACRWEKAPEGQPLCLDRISPSARHTKTSDVLSNCEKQASLV